MQSITRDYWESREVSLYWVTCIVRERQEKKGTENMSLHDPSSFSETKLTIVVHFGAVYRVLKHNVVYSSSRFCQTGMEHRALYRCMWKHEANNGTLNPSQVIENCHNHAFGKILELYFKDKWRRENIVLIISIRVIIELSCIFINAGRP